MRSRPSKAPRSRRERVKLVSLRVDGFGRLVDRAFDFAPGFNVVVGPNEAGKSTLSSALLASLYGLGRGDKERYRPWAGARFATALTYELADGRAFEVQREFERDGKGVRVYDVNGNDASVACSVGKVLNPGHAHLGIPLEVFVNASFVAQGAIDIDGARAERITHALARALDGGPKEDAALGAMKRLDDALAQHIGRRRATVHAPLRRLQDEIAAIRAQTDEVRAGLRALDDLRARLAHERERADALDAALREHERRARALRAHALRARLDGLREIREDLAALHSQRADYADVEGFPANRVSELEALFRSWQTLDTLARAHADEAERRRLTPALASELEERNADGGALDDDAFAALDASATAATQARDRAAAAAERAQRARRAVAGGSELFGALVTASVFIALGAAVLGVAHVWAFAAAAAVLALALFVAAVGRANARRQTQRAADAMQLAADRASAEERDAARVVGAVLERLGVPSFEELVKRRERARELRSLKSDAAALAERATASRREADAAAAKFDALAERLVVPSGARARDLEAAKTRESRKIARDGIDVRLSMLDVRRGDLLRDDDEFALERELDELLAAGVEPLADGASARALEAERADLERRASESRALAAAAAAELRASEAQIGDLAALDERAAILAARAARLERFESAVTLARATIDARTREAHQKFARRLADYASTTLASVTGERYLDVRVDPTTLAIRVRVPETGEIVDVDRLSTGTREQAALVVRLAMVRMFSEGLEVAPLLLDDPFAYWDDARIERGLPILAAAAEHAQVVLFTTSAPLARAAAGYGARLLDLGASLTSARRRVDALDGDEDLPLLSQA
jgi:DNA repair exonuclease SbcCD ATPase subunit